MKIIRSNIFSNEIILDENFPDYSTTNQFHHFVIQVVFSLLKWLNWPLIVTYELVNANVVILCCLWDSHALIAICTQSYTKPSQCIASYITKGDRCSFTNKHLYIYHIFASDASILARHAKSPMFFGNIAS